MDEAIKKEEIGIKNLFPYKSYLTLLFANIITRFGDSIDAIAFSWMVYILTGSKLLMGTIFAVNTIPNLLFSVFAGVFADKFSKKRITFICDIGRGLIVGLTAILFYFDKLEIWYLFLFTFIISTFESFASPARSSLTALLLPEELYLTASSFATSSTSFAQLIGVGIAGFLIATIGISGAIFIDAITFLFSAIIVSFIKVKEDINKGDKASFNMKGYFKDIKEGFEFLRKESILFLSISLIAFANFSFMPFNVLRPVYVDEILGLGVEGLSYMGIGFSVGMIIGGLLTAQFGSKFKKSQLVIFGFSGMGLCYALFSLPSIIDISVISPIILVTIICIIFGTLLPVASSPLAAYMYRKTPKNLLGRVSSVSGMLCLSAIPLGAALTGVVSEYVSIPTLFLSLGIAIIIASLSLSLNKDFKKV